MLIVFGFQRARLALRRKATKTRRPRVTPEPVSDGGLLKIQYSVYTSGMIDPIKPLRFRAPSLEHLRACPTLARREAGY